MTIFSFIDYSLNCNFGYSVKQPDASLRIPGTKCPIVVLEVGISKDTDKLYEEAQSWLEGSDSDTKLVILIDI